MKVIYSLVLFTLVSSSIFSQIESGKKGVKKGVKKTKQKKEKSVEIKRVEENEDKTLIYLNYNYGNSFRLLKPNGDFYGKPLGERANETPLATGGFNFGFNSKITKNLNLDFGLGYVKYGEQATKNVSDTVMSYETSYSNLILPLKLHFEKGKKVRFFVNFGLQAQLFTAYLNKSTENYEGNESVIEVKKLSNSKPFSVAGVMSLGIQYHFSENACLLLSGDYTQQISSTYNKQAVYIHKANRYAFSIGLGLKI